MNRIVGFLFDALGWTLHALGPRRAAAFGRGLGSFVFHVVRVRRKVVVDNLSRAFPEKSDAERKAIARGVYRHLGRILVEIVMLPWFTPEERLALVRLNGFEKLEASRAAGRGALVCVGHMGNWELFAYVVGKQGRAFHAITKTLKGAVNERLHAMRSEAFRELPPDGSFEAGLEVLAGAGWLAHIMDQHREGPKAVAVDFFGRPAGTSPAPALFALRSGCDVYTAFMTLADDGRYEVTFEGPFPVPDAPDLNARLVAHTQLLTRRLEDVVRAHPDQWFWVHRRWKLPDRPPGSAA